MLLGRCVILNGQADLVEVVLAAHPSRAFACRLDRWKQQGHKYSDDRDHDEQLD
jgi:hypothetical protein